MLQTELLPVAHVLDALNCGAALVDRAGRLVHVNGRVLAMTGWPRERIVGRSLAELYAATDALADVRAALLHFDEPREDVSFLPTAQGDRLPVVISAAPLGDEPPMSDHRVVTLMDVSLLKAAEEDARSQYRYIAEISNTVIEQALALRDHSKILEEKVRQRTRELREAHDEAIYMLAVASEAKDHDTGLHVRRIQRQSERLARRLGLSPADAEAVGYAAILHDVGKFHVPDRILQKPGPLTPDERAEMQQHTLAGERIISDGTFWARARRIARSHHENWDGSGYPDGVANSHIPLEARIVHVVDVYDALTNVRAYKPAWPAEQALAEIKAASGRMFEPEIVKAFEAVVGESRNASSGGAVAASADEPSPTAP